MLTRDKKSTRLWLQRYNKSTTHPQHLDMYNFRFVVDLLNNKLYMYMFVCLFF